MIVFEGVNLLLKHKNISQSNPVELPSHLVTSNNCQCHRLFHIFCTNLLPQNDSHIDMIYIHPAPLNHERDSTRRVSTSFRKSHHKHYDDIEKDIIVTARSEPCQVSMPENQLFERKVFIICVFDK